MPVRVGFAKADGTVITADMPQQYTNKPLEIPVLHNITKADYKAPNPDYWFWCWDTSAPPTGDNCLCRARLLPNNTIQVDVTRMNLPFNGFITQITADYLTVNAVGGHIFVGFDFGQFGFFGAFKFTITQDNPLILASPPAYFLFGQGGFPNANRVGGIALNTTHTILTVLYNNPQDNNEMYACIVNTGTFAQVGGSPVKIGTPAGVTNQGFRLETDVWQSSYNYGWQVLTGKDAAGGYRLFAVNPDTLATWSSATIAVGGPIDFNHSFRNDGELCLIAILSTDVANTLQFRQTPINAPAKYSGVISEAHENRSPATYDVEKIGQRRYYGNWNKDANTPSLRRWSAPPPALDDVSVYASPGVVVYAVACVREGFVIP